MISWIRCVGGRKTLKCKQLKEMQDQESTVLVTSLWREFGGHFPTDGHQCSNSWAGANTSKPATGGIIWLKGLRLFGDLKTHQLTKFICQGMEAYVDVIRLSPQGRGYSLFLLWVKGQPQTGLSQLQWRGERGASPSLALFVLQRQTNGSADRLQGP